MSDMSNIKAGDWFTINGNTDNIHKCCHSDAISVQYVDHINVYTIAQSRCTKVRVTIRPVKAPRKWKPSELRAWLESYATSWGVYRSHREEPFKAWTAGSNSGTVIIAEGPTEAKAILALRKTLRAKGMKL